MLTKQISSFYTSASVTQDAARIVFKFSDGGTQDVAGLTPWRFVAIMTVLQSSPNVYYNYDENTTEHFVSSAEDCPGKVNQVF